MVSCASRVTREEIRRYPSGRGKQDIYVVQRGETLEDVAKKFNVNVDDLKKANNLGTSAATEGQRLTIPPARKGEEMGERSEPPAEKPEPRETPSTRKRKRPQVAGKAPHISIALAWPLNGKILSGFGIRGKGKHDGVDIGAPEGTPIMAAADGTVIFSGWGPSGYGNIVVIRHTDTVVTVYAHNKQNVVERGTAVKQGMEIATVGSTGRATTAHCHFEVRVNRIPYDPLAYLGKP